MVAKSSQVLRPKKAALPSSRRLSHPRAISRERPGLRLCPGCSLGCSSVYSCAYQCAPGDLVDARCPVVVPHSHHRRCQYRLPVDPVVQRVKQELLLRPAGLPYCASSPSGSPFFSLRVIPVTALWAAHRYLFPRRLALHRPGWLPRFLDRAFPARQLHHLGDPDRCLPVASLPVSGFILLRGELADPGLLTGAESSSLALQLMGSPAPGFGILGSP